MTFTPPATILIEWKKDILSTNGLWSNWFFLSDQSNVALDLYLISTDDDD